MAFDGPRRSAASPLGRVLLAGLACAAVAVILLSAFSMLRARGPRSPAPVASGSAAGVPSLSGVAPRALAKSTVEFPGGDGEDLPAVTPPANLDSNPDTGAEPERDDDEQPLDDDGAPDAPATNEPPKKVEPKHFASVQEAASGSCSTVSIEGLSKQIIEQARCLNPSAFVALPVRPNLVTGPHVFPYMQAEARTHLVRVLDAHKNTTLKVNSALRTVAQQYLVWRWSATKSCGVELATRPGESNHELGLALDVADHASWRSALEAEQFHWLGASDRVHFDFKTAAAPTRKMTDVLAFQKLWNRNHPADLVAESGEYGLPTEQRLKKAPADGFALGPACGKAKPKPNAKP